MLHVRTLEGVMGANVGDWIIKGVQGEFYPCKPDIFAATYEPADAPPSAPVPGERPAGWTAAELLADLKDRTERDMVELERVAANDTPLRRNRTLGKLAGLALVADWLRSYDSLPPAPPSGERDGAGEVVLAAEVVVGDAIFASYHAPRVGGNCWGGKEELVCAWVVVNEIKHHTDTTVTLLSSPEDSPEHHRWVEYPLAAPLVRRRTPPTGDGAR